jgi:hypothetical protein
MKNIFTLLLLISFTAGISAQELDSLKTIMDHKTNPEEAEHPQDATNAPVIVDDNGDEVNVKVMDQEIVKVIEDDDSTYVKVGDKGILQVIENHDSTRIRVGDKEISIVERGDDTDISFSRVDEHGHRITNPRFRGHWAGFEWGINNFLDADFTMSREDDASFMDLNTGRSSAINLNFAQYSLGFGTSHFGSVIGLGLEFNNYFFDGDNTIAEEDDYVVGVDTTDVTKSKLTTTFLRIPLILEVQFPNTVRAKRMYISAGAIVGLKLASHTKVVYDNESGKSKDKNKDDFNINPIRIGLTSRIGFGNFSIFGDYYFTPMFVEDKGPELHPFTVGLALAF